METKTVAIAGLVVLESIALLKGVDGAFFLPVAGIIAGLAGYEFGILKERRRNGK